MKRLFVIFACIAQILAVSCAKTGVKALQGSYTFKTGGYIDFSGKSYDISILGDTLNVRDTGFVRTLTPERGQLRVLPSEDDGVIITMNVTGGDPVVFTGKVQDLDIILDRAERAVILTSDEHSLLPDFSNKYILDVCGRGHLYDNTLIFELEYSGSYSSASENLEGKAVSSSVKCIAVKNE